MSILDISEDQIFRTLGQGKDPTYKPVSVTKINIKVEPFDFSKLLE